MSAADSSCTVDPVSFFMNCRENTYTFKIRHAFFEQIYNGKPLPEGLVQTGSDVDPLTAAQEANGIQYFMTHVCIPEQLTKFPIKVFDRYKYHLLSRFVQQYAAEKPELLNCIMIATTKLSASTNKTVLRSELAALIERGELLEIYRRMTAILTSAKIFSGQFSNRNDCVIEICTDHILEAASAEQYKEKIFKRYLYLYLAAIEHNELQTSIVNEATAPEGNQSEVLSTVLAKLNAEPYIPALFAEQLDHLDDLFAGLIKTISDIKPCTVPKVRNSLERIANPFRFEFNYPWSDTPYLGFSLQGDPPQIVFRSHQSAADTTRKDFSRMTVQFNDELLERSDQKVYYYGKFKQIFFGNAAGIPAAMDPSLTISDFETETSDGAGAPLQVMARSDTAAISMATLQSDADEDTIMRHFNTVIGHCGQDLLGIYMAILFDYQTNLD